MWMLPYLKYVHDGKSLAGWAPTNHIHLPFLWKISFSGLNSLISIHNFSKNFITVICNNFAAIWMISLKMRKNVLKCCSGSSKFHKFGFFWIPEIMRWTAFLQLHPNFKSEYGLLLVISHSIAHFVISKNSDHLGPGYGSILADFFLFLIFWILQ